MKPTLLVLAAGMGSRYGGVKQIDAVGKNGECLLDFACFDAKKSGFENVVFIIRKDIEADFRNRLFDRVAASFPAEYVFQNRESLLSEEEIQKTLDRKKPWGTVHAVLCAREKIARPFAVINSDDYYGREAFKTLGEYLAALSNDSTEHAMVGYTLKKTMSHNGSVSRGVCCVEGGYLKSIEEHTKIYFEGEKIISDIAGEKKELLGSERVSMNLFGFSPAAFFEFEKYWEDFKKADLLSEKKEALLPVAASEIIQNKKGKIKFFASGESWFGMTYPQDREIVKSEIAKKISAGYYPEKLWG